MIITDPHQVDNPIIFANEAFSKLTGYAHEDIIGRNCRFLQGLDTDQSDVAKLRTAIAQCEPIEIELLNYKKTGETFWNRLLVSPVFDDNGMLTYFFASQYDVSSQKLAEQSLYVINETLELRVAQIIADHSKVKEELHQSQKMEAIGQLTGGLAHDFNNLVAAISGSLELMQIRISQGRLKDLERYMVIADGAAKRAAALTQRLLAFSRRQTLAPKPTNVNAMVDGMLDLIQRMVGPSVQIKAGATTGLWPALVDQAQLENALLNLCINARDAMPGGGKITIETGNRWVDRQKAEQQDMLEGEYLLLCVTDTGTGMTPEVVAKAFDPFFTTKPIGQGTGLGLSMIYGFAKQSGGQVYIHSEIGKGTTVCIYLPRHRGEADEGAEVTKVAEQPRAEAGETVLVVDDELAIRMLITDVLGDLGYTVIEAADGAGGLRVLQSDARIDLLITDIGLPGGMSGRQMADEAWLNRPNLQVLFITGYAENALPNNEQLAPGMSVLTKPFAVDALAVRVRELIAG